MRLDRYISENSALSRAEIKRMCRTSRVHVNDRHEKNSATRINIETDVIRVDDTIIRHFDCVYIMMNKPIEVVSATRDSEHVTVCDLLYKNHQAHGMCPEYLKHIQRADLQIVGRLDIDTSGMLLLTDDGQWNHRITSPKRVCKKTYWVKCQHAITPETRELFEHGIALRGEKHTTRPAQLDLIDDLHARVTIHEGKYHQVKRMFAACQNSVEALHRESIGKLRLDTCLAPGDFRVLSTQEIALF